jgi:tripartite-type tricarboxylate transporter receptor subunit TctC
MTDKMIGRVFDTKVLGTMALTIAFAACSTFLIGQACSQSYPSKPVRLIVPFPRGWQPGSRRWGCFGGGDGLRPPGLWHRAQCWLAMALTALMPFAATTAYSQTYPSKPVRLIVPFPPGGGTEPIARLLSAKFPESFGQQLIVDNRPGAGTTIGVEQAAKAPPDGYTLLLGSVANTISVGLYRKLNFDLAKDFAPITLLGTTPGILVVHPTLPVKTVKDLVALAKARPGQLAYSSSGNGTPNHLSGELFDFLTGVKLIHVPYKGGGPSIIALLSGEVSLCFASMPSAIEYVRNGKMRALAVTTAQRSPSLPQVPTVIESGVPGYEAETWYGLSAPTGTAKDILARLHAEFVKIAGVPDVKDRMENIGVQARTSTPEEYGAFTRREIEKWAKVIKAANMRAD